MPRPSRLDQQRRELLPVVTQVFSDHGYRGATTAELARRCGVRENILYRLWKDKKAMFLAALDDLFDYRVKKWREVVAEAADRQSALDRLVAYEAEHQGEFGFYRVVFTALAEADDPEIRAALVRMYRGFHQMISRQIAPAGGSPSPRAETEDAAWALIGLATVSNIVRHLELLPPKRRERMFISVAERLVERLG